MVLKNKKKFISALLVTTIALSLCGCRKVEMGVIPEPNNTTNTITGSTYNCDFYTNSGEKLMELSGSHIELNRHIVLKPTFITNGVLGATREISSVISIIIDGSNVESCGSTVIFADESLEPDIDFSTETEDKLINNYKDLFKKPIVVLIQSQFGDPIVAYSGDEVVWEECYSMPETTQICIDGKYVYIHRSNFQLLNKNLLQ